MISSCVLAGGQPYLRLNVTMPDKPDADPPAPLYLFHARGATRITHQNAARITEGFDKDDAPSVGAIGVLVQTNYYFDDSDNEGKDGGGDYIVALAIVRGILGVASGMVRATLAPIHRLLEPVPLDSLQDKPVELGDLPADFYSRKIDSKNAAALIFHLVSSDPTLATWLEQMFGETRSFSPEVEQSRVEAKDAVQFAAQIAGIELPPDAFMSPPTPTKDETLLQTLLNTAYEQDLEEELLPLDLQRFDGKLIGKQRAASLTVFTDAHDENKQLIVMSVNKKPIEVVLGVDLLYWDQAHDAFTFIQYKRLEKVSASEPSDGTEWAYLRKSEIEKQLKLMPGGRHSPAEAAHWRAFDTPFWFKFVYGDAAKMLDGMTLKGMYISADWLRLAMKEDTFKSGPKGGFRVTHKNAKYLTRTTFTDLISKGFVGTAGARSDAFKKVLHSKDRELIIAVRTDWEKDDDPFGIEDASGQFDGEKPPF